MAIYAIGDIQGCYDEFRALLDRIHFDDATDKLWLVGDLVNRGPKSLEVLRYVKALGEASVCVLGNHDLHLLALSEGNLKHKKDSSLDAISLAQDKEELIHWLRHRPLMHQDAEQGYTLIHAGLAPQWTVSQAQRYAREVEKVLRGKDFHDFMHSMYGNRPNRWSNRLQDIDRLRFIVNCFTRLRYCDEKGNLDLKDKGSPGSQKAHNLPWFEIPGRRSCNDQIICGHWSTLGYLAKNNVWALDTGCVWNGRLTALKIIQNKPPRPIQVRCRGSGQARKS